MNARWLDVRLSPDGRRCVFLTRAERGAPWAVSYLELPDGQLQQASLPPGQDHAESVGILNDGRLVLVTGERPKDLEGRRMWYGSELPQGDSWKPTYEPVKVWVWDPQSDEAPTLLHAEEEMSLDWELPTTSSPLYLCRIVGDGPRRKEFVEVRLDGDPPEVRPCRPGKFVWWRADQASADRRFVVKTYEDSFPRQSYVRDTVTGRSRRLRDQPGWFEPWVLWSPQGHKFLYTTAEAPLIMPWESRIAAEPPEEAPRLVEVVRLVDLDR
jgi:dipeptidyl aminopeptidase/acylaminoacyl peptidase